MKEAIIKIDRDMKIMLLQSLKRGYLLVTDLKMFPPLHVEANQIRDLSILSAGELKEYHRILTKVYHLNN